MKTETIKCRERDAQRELWKKTVFSEGEINRNLSSITANSQLRILFKNTCVFIGSAILFGSSLNFFLRRKSNKRLCDKIEKLNVELASAELQILGSKLNPHFIFNALNSINQFVSKNDTHLACDFINRFAMIMRKTLINSEKEKVLLEDDLELLDLYLKIEADRLNNKFDYVIEVDPCIIIDNTLVPPGLIQPLVENSIWHGITPLNKKGLIKITINQENGSLIYQIEDNGVGIINPVQKENILQESRGIRITRDRINLLNQLENKNGEFKISDRPDGVTIKVELPFEKAF